MSTSFLVGKCEVAIVHYSSGWAAEHSPYERPTWMARLERNILTKNEYGVNTSRLFSTEEAAINLVESVLKSIQHDYDESYVKDDARIIRKRLLIRAGII